VTNQSVVDFVEFSAPGFDTPHTLPEQVVILLNVLFAKRETVKRFWTPATSRGT